MSAFGTRHNASLQNGSQFGDPGIAVLFAAFSLGVKRLYIIRSFAVRMLNVCLRIRVLLRITYSHVQDICGGILRVSRREYLRRKVFLPSAHVSTLSPSVSASSTLLALGNTEGHNNTNSRHIRRAQLAHTVCRCARFLSQYSIPASSLLRHQDVSAADHEWAATLAGDGDGLHAFCSRDDRGRPRKDHSDSSRWDAGGQGAHVSSADVQGVYASSNSASGSLAACVGGFHVQRVNAGYLIASELCSRGWVWAPADELWPKGGGPPKLATWEMPGVAACPHLMPTLTWQISPERVKTTAGGARAAATACTHGPSGHAPTASSSLHPYASANRHHGKECAGDGRGPILANQLAGIGLTTKGTLWEILSGYSRARSPPCVDSIIGGLLPRTYRLYDEQECRLFFHEASATALEPAGVSVAHLAHPGNRAAVGGATGVPALLSHDINDEEVWWIIKPVGKSGGRGVRLFVPSRQGAHAHAGLTETTTRDVVAAAGTHSDPLHEGPEEAPALLGVSGWWSSVWSSVSAPWSSGVSSGLGASGTDTHRGGRLKGDGRTGPAASPSLPGPLDAYGDGSKCREVSLLGTTVEIAQEYLRSPLLLLGRKFDIRVYAVVVSTAPLVVFYHSGQLRVSMVPFNDDPADRFSHLTNSAVQKELLKDAGKGAEGGSGGDPSRTSDATGGQDKSWAAGDAPGGSRDEGSVGGGEEKGSQRRRFKGQGDSPGASGDGGGDGVEDGRDDGQHHWSLDQLDRHLARTGAAPRGVVARTLVPRIKRAMVFTLRAAEERMEADPGLFQVFGFDFLVEAHTLRVLLLEVNRNPLLFPSSPVKMETTPALVRSTLGVVLALLERRSQGYQLGATGTSVGDGVFGDGPAGSTQGRVFPPDISTGSLEPIIDGEWEFGNMDGCN
eukprot:jgi/Mesvir1/18993/Mv18954-RA.1